MANLTYAWNPFQTQIDNRIVNEIIKPSNSGVRREFLVRRAPFFSHNFSIRREGSNTPLTLGEDYVFAHPFDRFIVKYHKNVFGSVILLKDFGSDALLCDYDTIGDPFVLDEIAYVALAANIIDKPRIAEWEDLINVPLEWPPEPHEHPITQTYDYLEMMTALRSLVLALVEKNDEAISIQSMLEDHLTKDIPEAHLMHKEHLGLDLVPNIPTGKSNDLNGSSGNKLVTISLMKEALRRLRDGTLNID